MRILALAILLGVLVGCSSHKPAPPPVPIPKEESTLTWNRNPETNMQDYVVYACWTQDCTNLKAIGAVRHPLTGKPEFKVYLHGKVGTVAVTARNIAGKESGFSNLVPFDRR